MLHRNDYLKSEDVKNFITFIRELIKGEIPLNHAYHIDKRNQHFPETFVRNTDSVVYAKLEDAFKGYSWNRENYVQNKTKLDQLSKDLREAKTEDELEQTCLNCLDWGAGGTQFQLYTENKKWIDNQRKRGIVLSTMLNEAYGILNGNAPNLTEFGTRFRLNSGFTKLFALKYDNFIIYDSRVGAALGLLVRKFCEKNNIGNVPSSLKFPWGGAKKRNPSKDKLKFPKLSNNHQQHAEWNIKANWLLYEVIHGIEFWEIKDDKEKLRAIEAALFMIGYSVAQVLNAEIPPIEDLEEEEDIDIDVLDLTTLRSLWGIDIPTGWVPTSHDFSTAISHYLIWREERENNVNIPSFENWLEQKNIPTQNKYVQNRYQLNLNDQSLELIQQIENSCRMEELPNAVKDFFETYKNKAQEDRLFRPVKSIHNTFAGYLMMVYFCGQLAKLNLWGANAIDVLVRLEYAGTKNAAQAIITVGRSFGQHCHFLNEDNYPTAFFDEFFG